jgi:hypothetical protein
MTKKEKLETFDAIKAERDKLQLAFYDLTVDSSRFKFAHPVTVDVKKEIDGTLDDKYRVSLSDRAEPIYLIQCVDRLTPSGFCTSSEVLTESEIHANRENPSWYWRMVRHAVWKIGQQSVDRFLRPAELAPGF